MSGRILERWHDDGRGAGMGKSPPTQFVCEMVEGESYEYYLLGQYIVAAPGGCGGRLTFKYTRIGVYYALGARAHASQTW